MCNIAFDGYNNTHPAPNVVKETTPGFVYEEGPPISFNVLKAIFPELAQKKLRFI